MEQVPKVGETKFTANAMYEKRDTHRIYVESVEKAPQRRRPQRWVEMRGFLVRLGPENEQKIRLVSNFVAPKNILPLENLPAVATRLQRG